MNKDVLVREKEEGGISRGGRKSEEEVTFKLVLQGAGLLWERREIRYPTQWVQHMLRRTGQNMLERWGHCGQSRRSGRLQRRWRGGAGRGEFARGLIC